MASVYATYQGYGPAAIEFELIGDLQWRVENVFGNQANSWMFARELDEWSINFEKASRLKDG